MFLLEVRRLLLELGSPSRGVKKKKYIAFLIKK
jgi:hypothetical protein